MSGSCRSELGAGAGAGGFLAAAGGVSARGFGVAFGADFGAALEDDFAAALGVDFADPAELASELARRLLLLTPGRDLGRLPSTPGSSLFSAATPEK